MATKADFNAEEWSKIVEAPLLAGMQVASAGRGGTIRESLAVSRVYQAARQAHGDSPFRDELVSSPPGVDPQRLAGAGDLAAVARERLGEAVGLVSQKSTPRDVDDSRGFVLSVGRAAAEAHQEGGFLGIGGKQVSDEEQAALDEIAAALAEPPPT